MDIIFVALLLVILMIRCHLYGYQRGWSDATHRAAAESEEERLIRPPEAYFLLRSTSEQASRSKR